MRFTILSLFPEYFEGPFNSSIVKRAKEKNLIQIDLTDIRHFSENRHSRVDDRVYGGGPGMVLMPSPVATAIRSARTPESHVIFLSPQGKTLNAKKSRELAEKPHLILLCGHYEGIDQRVIDAEVDEEISIGDYILTNGCIAAIVLLDSVIRFIPGVLGHESAAAEDSFENGLLEGPSYTHPEEWEGRKVPPVLLSGHHEEIAKWRHEKRVEQTKKMRPDLLNKAVN